MYVRAYAFTLIGNNISERCIPSNDCPCSQQLGLLQLAELLIALLVYGIIKTSLKCQGSKFDA